VAAGDGGGRAATLARVAGVRPAMGRNMGHRSKRLMVDRSTGRRPVTVGRTSGLRDITSGTDLPSGCRRPMMIFSCSDAPLIGTLSDVYSFDNLTPRRLSGKNGGSSVNLILGQQRPYGAWASIGEMSIRADCHGLISPAHD
jgi:hypothetical protein